jgi:WD40 repeat protein
MTAPTPPDERAVMALLADLPADEALRLTELTVFGWEDPVPVGSVARLWGRTGGRSAAASQRSVDRLLETGLLVGAGPGSVVLPGVVGEHLSSRWTEDRSGVHRALVESHRDLVPVRDGVSVWADLDVEHLWRHLPHHLAAAGLRDELVALLVEPRWLLGRLDRLGTQVVGQDLQHSGDGELDAMSEAVIFDEVWPEFPDAVPVRLADRPPREDEETAQQLRDAPHSRFHDLGLGMHGPSMPHLFTLHEILTGPPVAYAAAVDGSGLVTVDQQGGVSVRDPDTTELLRAFDVGGGAVLGCGPGWLAVADGTTVRLWDPSTGAAHGSPTGDTGPVSAFLLGPDLSWQAVASEHRGVGMIGWRHAGGRLQFAVDDPGVLAVALDGSWLATGGADGAVRIRDATTGAVDREAPGRGSPVRLLVAAPDGSWVAVVDGGPGVRVHDAATGERCSVLDGGRVTDLVAGPDGAWVAVASDRPEVRLWDPRTGALLHTLHTPGVPRPTRLAAAPDGSWLVSVDEGGAVAVWRPSGTPGRGAPPYPREWGRVLADGEPAPGPDHPAVLAVRHNLAHWRGRDGAVAAFTELIADLERVLGRDDPATLRARHSLARWRGTTGDTAGAVAAHAELLADRLRVLGPDHPRTLASRHDLACARGDGGDPAAAIAGLTALVPDLRRVLGADHLDTLVARANLAHWRRLAGADTADDPDETRADHYGRVYEDHVRVLGPQARGMSRLRSHLPHWLAAVGRPDRAAAFCAHFVQDRWAAGVDREVAQEHLARWCAAADEGTAGAYPELLPVDPAHVEAERVAAALASLDGEEQRCEQLAVFREPVEEAVVDRLWRHTAGWEPGRCRAVRERLVGLGVLDDGRAVALSGAALAYLRRGDRDPSTGLGPVLLDAHRDLVPVTDGVARWAELDPSHRHLWSRLPELLREAGRLDELTAFLGDGRRIVTALDARGPYGVVSDLRYSPDPGQRDAATAVRRVAHLLGPLDPPGSRAATLAAHLAPGELPERLLAGIDGPHLVRVGPPPVTGPEPLRTLGGPSGTWKVLVAPDGSWLAAVQDEEVEVWDPSTGRLLSAAVGGPYGHNVLPFTHRAYAAAPDGSVLALAHQYRVDVVDPRDGVVLLELELDEQASEPRTCFSPDGSWLASSAFGLVVVWDPDDGEELARLEGHYADVDTIAAAPDGSWIATAPFIAAEDDDPDGTEPVLTVRIWDPFTGDELHTLPEVVGAVMEMGVAPDGSWLVTLTYGDRARIWDPVTGALLHTAEEADCQSWWCGSVLAVAPDGSCFAYAGRDDATVVVRDPAGALLHTIVTGADQLNDIVFAPDGRRLATAGQWGDGGDRVQFWDVATGGSAGSVRGAAPFAFAPDGTWVAAVDTGITLWPFPPGPDDAPGATAAEVTAPDGTWVATAEEDGTVLVRDRDGAPRHVLRGHTGAVTGLVAGPGDGRLATCGRDGAVRVWDAVTGRPLAALRVDHPLTGLRVEGRQLVATGAGVTHRFTTGAG